jgi:hypothetical protein
MSLTTVATAELTKTNAAASIAPPTCFTNVRRSISLFAFSIIAIGSWDAASCFGFEVQ